MSMSKIPLGEWVDSLVEWVTVYFAGLFSFITNVIDGFLNILVDVLSVGPPIVLIIILALLVTYTSRWPLGIFTFLSLLLIVNLGYWESSIQTLAIVLLSGFLTILIGIPVGIWCAQNKTVQRIAAFRFYANDACVCLLNTIYIIFWYWSRTRDCGFLYIRNRSDYSNDQSRNSGSTE